MNTIYSEALEGRLASSDDGNACDFTIRNDLCVPLALAWLSEHGEQWGFDPQTGRCEDGAPVHPIRPSGQVLLPGAQDGYWWLLTTQRSGAFVGVVGKGQEDPRRPRFVGSAQVAVSPDDLVAPNALGPPPEPSVETIVPGDSPRVLVGCGMALAGTPGVVVTREQFWQLTGDSYSLVRGERRTISYTETVGMETTSSTSETVATSLGMSASVGWGPVSTSVSASLSTSSTTFQQVSLSSERTTFVSRDMENRGDGTLLVLVWQMADVITVFEAQGKPAGSVVSSINPTIAQPRTMPSEAPSAPRSAARLAPPRIAFDG
ncbi:MAG TPA: hypothetical protein VFS37_01830 [Conexibacter sp.]|nr:hypothetical protein [Conexibacter sp.]